ncbi:unnamed protein product [Prunus armeniaca]|uniref:Transposase MuDR plant domain-containing protein n=1 Tax=Prunus armeniaca TaxID=36596 RepID=A0A6J5W0L7_PRUAR|nr:unnamed protein product [Prunus armeniaca]
MDVCVLHISVSNENKKLVDIDIVSGGGSSFGTGVEDDIDSSDNEDSNSTDENECLVKLGKNMKGVTEFRIKLCTYAFEKKFKFVYVKNDLKRVTAECIKVFPCAYAIAAILADDGDPYKYIEPYFTANYYRSCYGIPIALVPDIEKEAPKELEEFKVKITW